MKRLLFTLALLMALAVSLSAIPQPSPRNWEYKFEYRMNEKKANELGAQGWEITAIESTSSAGIGNNVPVYVFKRPKV